MMLGDATRSNMLLESK